MRRPSYASVAATLALVLSMSGGALAAGHYLINSTKQINPKVRKALTGAKGPAGTRGPTGPAGSNGKEGAVGPAGSFATTLSRGQTVRGTYDMAQTAFGAKYLTGGSISFTALMPSTPTAVVIPEGKTPPASCPGTVEVPQAEPGYLCIYELERENTAGIMLNKTQRTGQTMFIISEIAGESDSFGTWAATAG